MDVAGLIASFYTSATGYAVLRTANGPPVRGRDVAGATSTFNINAAVVPASGQDLLRLPEGRRTNETRAIFTTTQLYSGGQNSAYEPDKVTIDGKQWECQHVEVWVDPVSLVVGYRCVVQSAQ